MTAFCRKYRRLCLAPGPVSRIHLVGSCDLSLNLCHSFPRHRLCKISMHRRHCSMSHRFDVISRQRLTHPSVYESKSVVKISYMFLNYMSLCYVISQTPSGHSLHGQSGVWKVRKGNDLLNLILALRAQFDIEKPDYEAEIYLTDAGNFTIGHKVPY